jgi:NAD(P) transhydrogenase
VISLADGREICADRVIVCAGRGGATENLGLEENGIPTDTRGNILRENADSFRTSAPSVLAAGDVLGGFGLASTATIEGHSAAADAMGLKEHKVALPLPKGIYAMPEMASVGQTEEDLVKRGIPFVSAQAKYAETSKGVIRGEQFGFLKLLVHAETRELLGVHIIGEDAAELIHIGQLLIANKQTVDDLLCYAFNQPTFAETYKKAGFRCWNRLNGSQATLANS